MYPHRCDDDGSDKVFCRAGLLPHGQHGGCGIVDFPTSNETIGRVWFKWYFFLRLVECWTGDQRQAFAKATNGFRDRTLRV